MAAIGPDLNLLIPLRALLEEANLTRAGQRVHMGQSSMSSALARLRAHYNDELLVRVGRDYELTPFARVLLPHVQETVPAMERLLSVGTETPTEATRTLTLMISDYGLMRMQPAIAAVLEQAPHISVDTVSLPERPMESERDLITHDFVITVPGTGVEGESADLVSDVYVCLLDEDNPLMRDGGLSFDDFVSSPYAVAQFGRYHLTAADRRLRELGVNRSVPRITTAGFLPLPQVVSGTDLVALAPRELVRRTGRATGTVGVPTPFGEVGFDLRLWWHESHHSDAVHTWFRERLIDETRARRSTAAA